MKPNHALNPWHLLGMNPDQAPARNQRMINNRFGHLSIGTPPLGSLHPQTSGPLPRTGQGWAQQAHPYDDTEVKKQQAMRDLHSPWRAFAQESLNT